MEEVYGRCRYPREPECQAVQRVHNPEKRDGRLLNRCRFCHGPLVEVDVKGSEGGKA